MGILKSNKIYFSIFLISILLFITSCASTDNNKETEAVQNTETKQEITKNNSDYKVSEDVYLQTFSDAEELITKLNAIISRGNFVEWKKYLTKDYIDFYSSPENLKAVSETPTLKKYRIVLRSLKDYFDYVVVPSRSEAHLDSIAFVDDNNIKAYMIIDDQPVVLYTLVKVNENWKVGK